MNNETTSNNSETDWTRLDAMSDENIDLSDCPEVTPEMFANAVARRGARKDSAQKSTVTVAIDQDVLEWFKAQGDEAERQMALALRIYAEANKAYSDKTLPT